LKVLRDEAEIAKNKNKMSNMYIINENFFKSF